MYFHHGIAGTVGDVGGNMYVMQQTTEGEELLYCNGILSEGFLIVFMIYSRYMQKKKLVVMALVYCYVYIKNSV